MFTQSLLSTAPCGYTPGYPQPIGKGEYLRSPQRWWHLANKSRNLVGQAGLLALKQLHLSYTATALERNLALRQQMSRLLDTLGVHLQHSGQPMTKAGLFVANHISWLDAVIGAALQSASFIAKREVKDWPLIGSIAEDMDTVYINRHNKFAVYRELPTLERHVHSGGSVFFFPEGTTSTGFNALPFYPMLFEVAVRTGCAVQPVVIRYLDHQGRTLPEVAFVDEDSLTDSLWRLLKQSRITAHIEYLAPVTGSCRKLLARQCHAAIQKKLVAKPVFG